MERLVFPGLHWSLGFGHSSFGFFPRLPFSPSGFPYSLQSKAYSLPMGDRARLTVTTGPDRGRVFELAEEMVNIGRGAQNHIPLTDLQVAEHQATLMSRNGRYAIYVLRADSVEVDGNVIPAEQWVW